MRYVLEGTWSGYTSAQQRCVHRTVHQASEKKLRAWVDATAGIRYTDGTMLYLTIREARPRERVQTIDGYTALIRECALHNVNSVAALPKR